MARLARLYAPDTPQLAQAHFVHPLAQPSDPTPVEPLNQLAAWLRECAADHAVQVHGWALLPDRLTLLATPQERDSLSRLMQAVGRRFATRLQPGRVFQGRYRSALVQPGQWVLPVLVWLDTLPVQTGHVDLAENWPWSSAAYHTGLNLQPHTWPANHPDYWQLGNTPFDRQAQFRAQLSRGLSGAQKEQIEQALFGQWALGDAEFTQQIAPVASRRVTPGKRGRPRKADPNA
jgi:putative transposase